jgi:hypothetical protein
LRLACLFDEKGGATVFDKAGRRINGTINNVALNTAWKGGRWGTALELDGSNDTITFSNNAGVNFTNTQTWSVVVFFRWKSGGGTFPRIFARNGNQADIGVNSTGNVLSIFSGALWRATSLAIDASKWYMITFTCERNASRTVRGYSNTTPLFQENHGGAMANTGAITLGNNGAGAEFSNIIYSALLIYSRQLSVSDIGALYMDAFNPVRAEDELPLELFHVEPPAPEPEPEIEEFLTVNDPKQMIEAAFNSTVNAFNVKSAGVPSNSQAKKLDPAQIVAAAFHNHKFRLVPVRKP